MKPIVKKIAAAVAIKEGIEKVQEMRKPKKPSFVARLMPLALIGVLAGLGLFVYKNKVANGGTDYNGSAGTSGNTF
jgi:hypothetical protein